MTASSHHFAGSVESNAVAYPHTKPMKPLAKIAAVAVLVLAAWAGPAGAASTKGLLWATVNACDTTARPDRVGVRGSMPGTGREGKMRMRFSAQFFDPTRGAWRNVHGRQGVSPWLEAGSSKFKFRETGWNFQFVPPAPGATFLTRAAAEFEWRERRAIKKGSNKTESVVVKKRRALTKAGHSSPAGSDPAGFSASNCQITG